ncbi:hypothetical protein SS50377_23474 [Spironucleus salmonicida]|uniref:Uncharacterized protein n=1 Tax=Spironucleus salmonicida TaxID=348837 RepID=V6LNG9_9EUKA|nr:hypothetical protein SS50377_23474 [Spironucleus salmonicida]|eukprot:EST46212.1 hypothetical protein SS50377_13807 [Spironucleus salmonicida]
MTATLLNCVDGPTESILSFSKSSTHIAIGSQDNYVYFILLDTMEVVQKFEFQDSVTQVEFFNDQLLVAASLDGQLTYFVKIDLLFQKQRSQILSPVSSFMIYKKKIFVISEDSIAYILKGNDLSIITALSIDGLTSVTAYNDFMVFGGKSIELYDIKANQIINKITLNDETCLSLITLNQSVIFGSDTGKIHILSLRSNKLLEMESSAPEAGSQVICMRSLSINNYQLVLIGTDNSFICLEQNLNLRYENNLQTGICAIEFFETLVLCGCTDGSVIVFDVLKGEKICSFQGIVPLDEENLPITDLKVIDNKLCVTGDSYFYVYDCDFYEIQKKAEIMEDEEEVGPNGGNEQEIE